MLFLGALDMTSIFSNFTLEQMIHNTGLYLVEKRSFDNGAKTRHVSVAYSCYGDEMARFDHGIPAVILHPDLCSRNPLPRDCRYNFRLPPSSEYVPGRRAW